jgi:hypothetical protein
VGLNLLGNLVQRASGSLSEAIGLGAGTLASVLLHGASDHDRQARGVSLTVRLYYLRLRSRSASESRPAVGLVRSSLWSGAGWA